MRISECIADYFKRKRALGFAFETGEVSLRAFSRFVSDPPVQEISTHQILDFLNSRDSTAATWRAKHRELRRFFEFWADRGLILPLVMPHLRPVDRQVSVPFIYTRTEVRALIQGTRGNQANQLCAVSDQTFRAALLVLYGTGATTREIFRLKRDNLDLKRSLICVCGDRMIQSRQIPIGRDVRELLSNYLQSEERRWASCSEVFVSRRGGPLQAYWMSQNFVRLRGRAGILRRDAGSPRPRMRDLRPTFAVHRIASWIKEGADLNRMLPALSAYMGLAGVTSTHRYLFLTPERFKTQLDRLSPRKGRKHWRDDLELMKFLANL